MFYSSMLFYFKNTFLYVEFLIMLNSNLQSSIAMVLTINIIPVLLHAIKFSCNAPWTEAQ